MNIYKGILMSVLPMAVHCQHKCKHFALSVNFTVLLHKKLFLPIKLTLYVKKNFIKIKLIHYCTLLSMANHF